MLITDVSLNAKENFLSSLFFILGGVSFMGVGGYSFFKHRKSRYTGYGERRED